MLKGFSEWAGMIKEACPQAGIEAAVFSTLHVRAETLNAHSSEKFW